MLQPAGQSFTATAWVTGVTGGTPDVTTGDGDAVTAVDYSQTNMTFSGEVYRGPLSYLPTVTLYYPGGSVAVTLSDSGDRYTFSEAITVSGPGTLRLVTSDGFQSTVALTAQAAAPVVIACTIGALPTNTDPLAGGSDIQTAVKNNDVVEVTGTLDVEAADLQVDNYQATSGQGTQTFAGPFPAGAFAINVLMGTGNGLTQHVRVRGRTAAGTPGAWQQSTNNVEKDNDAYTIPDPDQTADMVYNGGVHSAVKSGTSVAVTMVISGYPGSGDSIVYDSPSGECTPTGSTSYADTKTWTYASGGYRESGDNVRVRAWKAKNGLLTTREFLIRIANTPPILSVSFPDTGGTTLRSQTAAHTLRLDSNQYCGDGSPVPAGTPYISVTGGSLSGRTETTEGFQWEYDLTINDAVANGAQTISLLVSPNAYQNRAGVTGTINSGHENYTVAGFESRDVVGVAFQEHFPIGKNIVDITNVTVERVGVGALTYEPPPITPPVAGAFTPSDGTDTYVATGDYIWWLDDAQREVGLVETMRIEETV